MEIAAAPISKTRQTIQFLVFMILLIAPLFVGYFIVSLRNEWVNALINFDKMIYVLVGWGAYGVILFYIYGTFFERPTTSSKKKTDTE